MQKSRGEVDYLRISVTDRCQLRCLYCMPPEGVPRLEHREILRFEEIARVVWVAAARGFRRFRLTGGEPLLRRDVSALVRLLAAVPGVEDLSLTTNGCLLAREAAPLKEAGLRRLNVSLDALDPGLYRRLTRGGDVGLVLAGLEAARRLGFAPIKLNAVIVAGVNESEILPLADFARRRGFIVRFIELMPVLGSGSRPAPGFLSGERVRRIIGARYPLEEASGIEGGGPARYWRSGDLTVGFISPLTCDTCRSCRRLRLTAAGGLRTCLFSEEESDLKTALRSGAGDGEIARMLDAAVAAKPVRHMVSSPDSGSIRMSAIGG
ncbi:MAG TPA: GTP 3',8-cyclase MoaA [bacterium]|nr:GTP 3',8-cyclase MoaA [bacterium]HPQ65913.1 GTP 3',8-cyclase MoaA [bacterium]